MTRRLRPTYPELPIDLVDATGLVGALAGFLSLALPYLFGLATTLAALLVCAGILRRAREGPTTWSDGARRRRYWAGFAASGVAWAFVFAHPAVLDRLTGVTLGVGGLPLWSIARRPLPFGGG